MHISVKEFRIEGDNPLGNAAYDAVKPFVGEYDDVVALSAATDALNSALANGGYRFHRATLPEQAADTGTIVIKMVDQLSGETVQQIPSEALLRLSAALGKTQGQLFDQKA